MSSCRTCGISCRCVASSNSMAIARMNHSQQNQGIMHSPYNLLDAQMVVVIDQQGLENLLRARDEQLMQTMFTNMEVRDRDRDASVQAMEAIQRETDARQREMENKQREAEAKQRETEAKQRETEAKQRETEAKQREMEAKQRETEAKLRETEAKLLETEAKQRQTEAKLRETEDKQDVMYRKIDNLEKVNQELNRMVEAGNKPVNGSESVKNSVGPDNANAIRTTVKAKENAARAMAHSNSDSVMRSLWKQFKGLSITQQCLVAAALAAIIGVVGWAAWNWVVPWVWPRILDVTNAIIAKAPRLWDQLLLYVSTLFQGQCATCGSTSVALKTTIGEFMTKGYLPAVTYLLPGFIAFLLANLEFNTV